MENEFKEIKEKFLSEIIKTKNLHNVKHFAEEIRNELNDIIEEYRKKDPRFDERLFSLEQEIIGRIFSGPYMINEDRITKILL